MPSASPVVHHTNGVQNYRAVFSLEFIHPRPASDMAPPIGRDRFPVWGELIDEGQAMHRPHQVHSGDPYPLKAALTFGINHRMWPDPAHMAAALEKLDFVANVDLFLTDSCRYADIVPPACTSVERSQLRCYPERWVVCTQPAIAPVYESRPDADIICERAGRLGLDDPLLAAGYEVSLDWILEPSGLTVDGLRAHPGGMPVPDPVSSPERSYESNGFATPSGKVEFVSGRLAFHEKASLCQGRF